MAILAILLHGSIAHYEEWLTRNSDHLIIYLCRVCGFHTDILEEKGESICPSPECHQQKSQLCAIEISHIVKMVIQILETSGQRFRFQPSGRVKTSYLHAPPPPPSSRASKDSEEEQEEEEEEEKVRKQKQENDPERKQPQINGQGTEEEENNDEKDSRIRPSAFVENKRHQPIAMLLSLPDRERVLQQVKETVTAYEQSDEWEALHPTHRKEESTPHPINREEKKQKQKTQQRQKQQTQEQNPRTLAQDPDSSTASSLETIFPRLPEALLQAKIHVLEFPDREMGERAIYRLEHFPHRMAVYLTECIRSLPGLSLTASHIHSYRVSVLPPQTLVDHIRQMPLVAVPEWLEPTSDTLWSKMNEFNSLRFRLRVKGPKTEETLVSVPDVQAAMDKELRQTRFQAPTLAARKLSTTQALATFLDTHAPGSPSPTSGQEWRPGMAPYERPLGPLTPSKTDPVPVALRHLSLLPLGPESHITGVQPHTVTVYARDLQFVPQGDQQTRMLGAVWPCVTHPDVPLVVLLAGEEIDMDLWFTVAEPFAIRDTWTGLVQQSNVTLRRPVMPVHDTQSLPSETAVEIWQTCENRERDDDEPNCFDLKRDMEDFRLEAKRMWACTECRQCFPLFEKHGLQAPRRVKETDNPDWVLAVETRSAQNAHELFRKGLQRMIRIGYEP